MNSSVEMREMMSDPKKVNCRIFVGSLPTDTMINSDLEKLFERFGEIEGALLNRGFGFVQFKNESSVKDAIAASGMMYHNRKIEVKPARPYKKPNFVPMGVPPNHDRDRSPIKDKGREPSRFPISHPHPRFPAVHTVPPPIPERPNDCEIIVVNKAQTEYAEYIEQKLRRLGLTVDLLFPNEDVPLARVLNNIANRGCLFAAVIMPQNEEHRSITVNILHGPPQEHRNMPVEDAVQLVSRSFEAHMLKEKAGRPSAVPVMAPTTLGSVSLADRHPESIQILLNLLAENRMLTVVQYDKIISYLQNRRELQLKVELGDAAPPPPAAAGLGLDKQQSLQSRILSILNTKAALAPVPVQTPANSTTPLLTDPSVQKALSSIMHGDILRKLAEPR